MKLTNKQALMLLKIAENSIKVNVLGLFDIDYETRKTLINEIYNQQSNELIDFKK
jgi:Mg/Co/Ni transporter MgtE